MKNILFPLSIPLFFVLFSSCKGTRPTNIGLQEGKLIPCPSSPNCLGSMYAEDSDHYLAPISWNGQSAEVAFTTLKKVLNDEDANIITDCNTFCDYLHVEFKAMGFVDDVEFYLDKTAGVYHFRSASRIGHSDMGANKRRMTKLTSKLTSALNGK